MGELVWIVRTIVILLIIRVVMRMLLPGQSRGRGARPTPRPPEGRERAGGALVRDPHCGTYIPQSRALKVGIGENAQYFCSAACRDAFAAARDSVAS
jgi:hypothetical protein